MADKKSSPKSDAKGAAKKGEERPKSEKAAPEAPYSSRLREMYAAEVVPKLKKEFGIDNVMAVPRIEKVVLNMGIGEAIQNIKILDEAVEEMTIITGQRPTVTRAHKSIAAFKLRQG